MYIAAVTVWVKPENVEQFRQAALDNARHTRQEPGNDRFDVLQHEEDPTRFLLYEVYRSKDGVAAHAKATGMRIRPGTWNMRISLRRLTMTTASQARMTRPVRPPTSWTLVTSEATRCSIARACGSGCP